MASNVEKIPASIATSTSGDNETENPSLSSSTTTTSHDAKHIKKLLTETKVSGGKSAWATTLETFGMSEGKQHKHDVILAEVSLDEAIKALQEKMSQEEKACRWDFQYTPFADFDATREDLLKAFCLWAKSAEQDSNNKRVTTTKYNISKAYRRLESYADWMEKNCQTLNLKGSTMKEVAQIWNMKLTHDKQGRAVWWIDIGTLDLKKIKKDVSHDDTLRLFVWLCHLVLFDQRAQENGFIYVQAIGKKGMFEALTCISMDVGTKMDRLSIGVLPIKMQLFYGFHNPGWMRVIMGLFRTFLSSKMRKRIIMISNKEDPQAVLEEALGKECIPCGIAGLSGSVEKDAVDQIFEKLS